MSKKTHLKLFTNIGSKARRESIKCFTTKQNRKALEFFK